jgi:pseudo-rSAM protein
MKNDGFRWLAAEPYVHGVVRENDVLLYNTVSRVYLVYRDNPAIAGVARQLLDPGNGYVVRLSIPELDDPSVSRLVSDLRARYMGDLFDPEWSKSKPFNIYPQPVIKKSSGRIDDRLREITFHLDTTNNRALKPFRDAHLQFPFPIYSDSVGELLSPGIIASVASQISSLPAATVNFIGTGILTKPQFNSLTDIFRETPFKRKFHVVLSQLTSPVEIRPGKYDHLCLYVTLPVNRKQSEMLENFGMRYASKPRVECNFVVRNSADVASAMEIIARIHFRHTYFKPFLDGTNMQFFRDQVFITEREIRASRPAQNQVFSRLTVNENDFGKITVVPNGDVFANMNDGVVGNLNRDNLEELAGKEIATGKSWLRRRPDVAPCSGCLYQFLCPPVSSYEIRAQRFNFCHIHPE